MVLCTSTTLACQTRPKATYAAEAASIQAAPPAMLTLKLYHSVLINVPQTMMQRAGPLLVAQEAVHTSLHVAKCRSGAGCNATHSQECIQCHNIILAV